MSGWSNPVFRSEEDAYYKGASYGRQNFIASVSFEG